MFKLNKSRSRINRVIKYFVFADLALYSGWGLVIPIFAVFIVTEIAGATLVTVGIGAFIYWTVRSIVQLPIAIWVDSLDSEKAAFNILLSGLVLTSIAAFLFIFINSVAQFYLVQLVHAVGMGMYFVAWRDIYSHHLDKGRVTFEWALSGSVLGISTGITGLLSGVVASFFGFYAVFLGAGIFSLVSAVIIFSVPDLILPPKSNSIHLPLRNRSI